MAHTTEFHCRICRIKLNMHVPSRFYYKVYEEKRDFYEQFYERLEEAKNFWVLVYSQKLRSFRILVAF